MPDPTKRTMPIVIGAVVVVVVDDVVDVDVLVDVLVVVSVVVVVVAVVGASVVVVVVGASAQTSAPVMSACGQCAALLLRPSLVLPGTWAMRRWYSAPQCR